MITIALQRHDGLLRVVAIRTSERMRRGLAAIAIASLLLSTLLTIADSRLVAWAPGHGHVFRQGVPVAHTHPWDARHREARLACVAPTATETEPVFTPSAEGLAGASLATPLLAGRPATPCTAALTLRPARDAAPMALAGAFAAVPTPPPRG
ncbi:MAG: hypothetical protein WEB13_08480 [Dehalococcoidia bacterium]